MITIQEAASRLNGNQYREEGSRELWAEMKAAGLVAVYGASDDLMVMNGAIDDEFSPVDTQITPNGVPINKCYEGHHCPNWKPVEGPMITPVWNDEGTPWTYKTTIPHATFCVMEDEETYCIGIVFALKDCVL